jgi:ABC-type amino acid transport substrate-binding protein
MYGSTDKGENMEHNTTRLVLASLVPLLTLLAATPSAAAGTALDRIKESGKLNLGYGDERPFSYKDESGKPAGYAIALCDKIADGLKADLGLPSLSVNYVLVSREEALQAVATGKIDILCAAAVPSLAARKEVSFSIAIFASGVGAVVRADASARLKDVLMGRVLPTSPVWRGNADVLLRQSTVSVVPGSRAERALNARLGELEIIPKFFPVNDNAAGVAAVADGHSNVFFGERAALLDSVKRSGSADLQVLDRYFTREPLALAVPRGDEDFRLAVDTALSGLYRSADFRDIYSKAFGSISENTLSIFRVGAPPE